MTQADNEAVAITNPDAPMSASIVRACLGEEAEEKGFQDLLADTGAGAALERR